MYVQFVCVCVCVCVSARAHVCVEEGVSGCEVLQLHQHQEILTRVYYAMKILRRLE